MANIDTYLQNIKNAVYGRDVRDSIHDAIDAINTESENTKDIIEDFVGGELDTTLTSTTLPAQGKAVGNAVDNLKSQISEINNDLYNATGSDFPLTFENGTYTYTATGSTLIKYYGGGYDLTRKVVKSTTFNAPCDVILTAKTGYSFTVFTANNGVITGSSGLVTSYTLNAKGQYGITLRTTGGTDDISALDASQIIDISYFGEVDKIKSKIKEFGDVVVSQYDLSAQTVVHAYISPSTNTWAINANTAFCYYITIPKGSKLATIKANANNQTIFAVLTALNTPTSGATPSYATGLNGRQFISAGEERMIAIPDDATYIWLAKTMSGSEMLPTFFGFKEPIPKVDPLLAVAGDAADAKVVGDKMKSIFPVNLNTKPLTSGIILYSTGSDNSSTAGLKTDYIDIEEYTSLVYSRITTTSSSATYGCAFYDESKVFIPGSGQRAIVNAPSYSFVLHEIAVPSGAKYARFTWNITLAESSNFVVYDAAQYKNTISTRIDKLTPNYSGKRVSILGDSISTFVASSDKVDGKAPEGCTTTYPGNPTQYSNSDVTSVQNTWWGRVIDHFGMVLGINESWAGSCIGYNPNQTSSGKYTATNCMCSETRIGHLGENGTPDIVIVFGGTNDINHHRVSNGSTLRYPVGELDSEHNPYDFENFPMITDTYYGSITTMLLRIQHSYPDATILMLFPYFCTYTHTSSGDRATPYDQNEWSKAARDVCNYLGVDYLDLRTIINMYDVSSLLFDDLHPKANGMEAIAKAVIHKLNSML